MIIYKRTFDENRSIYFSITEERVFIKYMEILEKVSNTIKKKSIAKLYMVKISKS